MADNLRVTFSVTGLRDVGGHRAGLVLDDLGTPRTENFNAYTAKSVVEVLANAFASAIEAKAKMGAKYSRVTLTVVVE